MELYLFLPVAIFLFGVGLYFITRRDKRPSNSEDNLKIESSGSSKGIFVININIISKMAGAIALVFGTITAWETTTLQSKASDERRYPSELYAYQEPYAYQEDRSQYKGNRTQLPEVSHPKFTEFLNQGLIHELEKQAELAFGSYRQALAQRSVTLGEAAQAMSRMAQIRLDQGYPDEAVLLARIAVDLEGENALYLNTLVRILIKQCQFDQAEIELDQIADDNPATENLREVLAQADQSNCTES